MTYSLFKRVQSILLCAMMMISLLADIPVSAEENECPLYGQHKLDGAVMFEAEHPHKQYVVCDCGFAQYTGSTMDYYAECETCNPQECQHTNTDISWDSNYKLNYVPISETQHQVTGYQYEYCTSCFEHIGSSFEATEIYNHDFNSNGDCPTCGYTHACKHSRTKLVVIDGYPAYSQYNETQHIVDIQYKEICRDCDEVVNQIVDSARDYKHEDHDFNKKGVCRDCGYVKLEEQEELKISVSANQSSAETGSLISASASASGGDGSYSFAWSVTCNGSTVADTDSGYGDSYSVTANQAGSYVFTATVHDGNGNQISGSSGTITVEEPACQHPTLEVAWDTYSVIPVSDTEHELTGYQHHYCTVCFEPVGSSFAATERVGHDFNSNGDCPTCGYTYKCKHTNTKFVPIDGYPTYHQHDEKQHIYDVRFKEVCTNPTCGTTVKDLVDSERIYEHQDHRFDENGKCQDCGYIKQEAQVPLEVAVSRGQASAQTGETITAKALATGGDGNYKYLWKVFLNGEEIQVTDLGMGDSYSWRAETAGTYTFSVTVLDGNNDSVTGSSQEIVVSQSKCMHETYTDIPGTVTYEQQSDAKHNKITLMSRVCDICSEPIGEYKKEESENHTFANGTCTGCGLAEPTADCQHEHAEEKLTDSKISNQGNTDQHVVTEIYSVICQNCGITVRTFEKNVLENHAFNAEGVCACGYAKPTLKCDHANRVEVQISTPVYVNNSDKDHTKTVNVRVECADCGITLEEEKTVTTTENHKFENGACACGQPEHVHTYEKVIVEKSNYVNQNINEHDVTVAYVMKCSGCGDTTEKQTETVREAHTYTSTGHIEAAHQEEHGGHVIFDRCLCRATRLTGQYGKLDGCEKCYPKTTPTTTTTGQTNRKDNQAEQQNPSAEEVQKEYSSPEEMLKKYAQEATTKNSSLYQEYERINKIRNNSEFTILASSVVNSYSEKGLVEALPEEIYKELSDTLGYTVDFIFDKIGEDEQAEILEELIKVTLAGQGYADSNGNAYENLGLTQTVVDTAISIADALQKGDNILISTLSITSPGFGLLLKTGKTVDQTSKGLALASILIADYDKNVAQLDAMIEQCGSNSAIGQACNNVKKEMDHHFLTNIELLNGGVYEISKSFVEAGLGGAVESLLTADIASTSAQQFVGAASGILLGGKIGGLLTYNAGAHLETKEEILTLSIIDAQVKASMQAAYDKNSEALVPLTALWLTTRYTGLNETEKYYKTYSRSLSNKVFHGDAVNMAKNSITATQDEKKEIKEIGRKFGIIFE